MFSTCVCATIIVDKRESRRRFRRTGFRNGFVDENPSRSPSRNKPSAARLFIRRKYSLYRLRALEDSLRCAQIVEFSVSGIIKLMYGAGVDSVMMDIATNPSPAAKLP